MQTVTEWTEGVYLRNLDPGSILDVETKGRHYMIKYLGGDEILISGHPLLCPTPVSAELCGSVQGSTVESGFVGRGLRLAFRRLTDDLPVITSPVKEIHQGNPGGVQCVTLLSRLRPS
jgi:hypothetical protein